MGTYLSPIFLDWVSLKKCWLRSKTKRNEWFTEWKEWSSIERKDQSPSKVCPFVCAFLFFGHFVFLFWGILTRQLFLGGGVPFSLWPIIRLLSGHVPVQICSLPLGTNVQSCSIEWRKVCITRFKCRSLL